RGAGAPRGGAEGQRTRPGRGAEPGRPARAAGREEQAGSCRRAVAASACVARKIHISAALGGQRVGIKEADDRIWIVSFMRYDLGTFCYPCVRAGQPGNGTAGGTRTTDLLIHSQAL